MYRTVESKSGVSEMLKFAMLCRWAEDKAETLRKHAAIVEKRDKAEALGYLIAAKKIEKAAEEMEREQARPSSQGQHSRSMKRFEAKMRLMGLE